jgi:glycerol kinase
LSSPKTLGFNLGLLDVEQRPVGNLIEFTKELVATLVDAQTAWLLLRPDDIERTVFIDTGDIGATDFDLTPAQIRWLVEQGAKATEDYFKPEKARGEVPSWLLERLRTRHEAFLSGL